MGITFYIKNSQLTATLFNFLDYVLIDKLEVWEEFRNNGIGTAFIKQVQKEFKKDILVTVLYKKPLPFYYRLGFEHESEEVLILRYKG